MPRSQRLISWSYNLLFILVPLIFLTSTSELFEFNKMIVTYFLTIVIVTVWLIRMLLVKRFIFHRTIIDLPLFIFLLSQLLSLFFSLDVRVSWLGYYGRFNGGFISLVCYALLYWAFVSNMTRKSALSAITLLISTAAFVSLWGILERFGGSLSCLFTTGKFNDSCWVQDVQTRVFASLGQPNWLAAYLVGLIFIPISHLQPSRRNLWPWALIMVVFTCLLFTNSRSGLLAFAAASVVYWGLYLWRSKNWKVFLLLNSLFLLPVFIFPNVARELVLKPFAQASAPAAPGPAAATTLETGGTESTAIRRIVWTGALRSWRSSTKNILLGSGPETFSMTYYQFRPIEHNNTSEWELLYNKAHNEFLNFLTTTGVIGLGAYLLLLSFMFLQIFKTYRHQGPESWTLNLALLAGWFSLSITNYWGFSVVITQLQLFLLPALAVVLSTPSSPDTPPSSVQPSVTRYILAALVILAGLFTALLTFRYWLADTYYATAVKFERQFSSTQDVQDILTAFKASHQAFELESAEPVYNSELGTLAAYMSLLTSDTDATASADFTQAALAANRRAIAASPFHPNYYKSFSRTLILLSTHNEAFLAEADQILSQAQAISPTDPRIPYNRGIIAKYQKNYAAAAEFFRTALRLKPDFTDSLVQEKQLATLSAMLK